MSNGARIPGPAALAVAIVLAMSATPCFASARDFAESTQVDVNGDEHAGGVTISRAADLVGVPINIARPVNSSTAARKSSTSGNSGGGTMPSGMPVAARALTSSFGFRQHPVLGGRRAHQGVDLAAVAGTPIVATSAGVVSADGWHGGYGLLVTLDHGGGVQTRYGHMSRLNVVTGQRVRKGDTIGYVGSTGRSTGPHLHYEMRIHGQPVDPISTLRGN